MLVKIVEPKVTEFRRGKSEGLAEWPWWQYWRIRTELAKAKAQAQLPEILATADTSKYMAWSFIPAYYIANKTLVLVTENRRAVLSVLQSRTHELWARFFGSSLEDRLRYTATDCFETFPFPKNWEHVPTLEAIGKEYYEYRAALMAQNNHGLTDTYNRFHNPEEQDPGIFKLRDIHEVMDRAVLDAYGWTDIPTACEFHLDYEEDEDMEAETASGHRKKKPYRYRWPAEVHDEVLARLLDLNLKRAEEESLSGAAAEAAKKRTAPAKKPPAKAPAKTRAPAKKKGVPEGPLSLFGDDKEKA